MEGPNEGFKEVHFNEYCKTCISKDTDESEDPCYECLAEPVNMNSHKPIRYEKKEEK